jgi:hypothetical protein
MTILGRAVRRLLERLLGRWHEGPRPPRRYQDAARAYRLMRPYAQAEQWEAFAVALAERAYREGWMRGFEWAEREFPKGPELAPAEPDGPQPSFLLERPLTSREAAEQRALEDAVRAAARQGRVRLRQ